MIFTENSVLPNCPENVLVKSFSRTQFNKLVSDKLGVNYVLSYGYKLCDLKPAYGDLFEDWLIPYDFWGYVDIDVVLGSLKKFLPESLLAESDIVTASHRILVGHFTILRNTERFRRLYRECPDYLSKFLERDYKVFDEEDFSSHVKSLAATGSIRLTEVPMLSEDCLIWWAGRPCFLVVWAYGRLFDILTLRELGYFHFIQTKYRPDFISSIAARPGESFVISDTGFRNLGDAVGWLKFVPSVIFCAVRTFPWYLKILLKLLIPRAVRRRLRGLKAKRSRG